MHLARLARLALLPAAILLGAADDPNQVVAQRGDIKLTASELRRLIDQTDASTKARIQADPAVLQAFVRDRMLREIVMAEAHAQKYDERPDVVARLDEARAQIIVQGFVAAMTQAQATDPTDQEVMAAFEANKTRLMTPREFNVAQIAVMVPPNSFKSTEDEIEKKVRDIRAQLNKPKPDFAELAKKYSEDKPSAPKGGELGWVREDQLIPAIRAALVNMKDGQISEPIRSGDAWHIVRLSGVRQPQPMTLAQAREGLVAALRQSKAQAAARAYVQSLLQKDPITINEIELTKNFPTSKPAQ